MRLTSFLMPLILLFCLNSFAQNSKPKELFFRNDSTFKIIQFTDVHWVSDQVCNASNVALMNDILDREKPDLVVYTGDVVLSEMESLKQLQKAWTEVTQSVRNHKVKWIAMLGNHDSEGKVSRDDVYKVLSSLDYNINPKPNGILHDFALPVKTGKGEIGAAVYLFDSNDYASMYQPGKYGWIGKDQVERYQQTSDELTKQHQNTPVPSLAFFHIPIPEYKQVIIQKDKIVGHAFEDVSSPEINTGLYAAMALNGDVIGAFCGHDHNNDFIGELNNIGLAYGRCTGSNAYGELRNGARVITLYPHQFSFDTWISIPSRREYYYHYPADMPVLSEYLPAVEVNEKLQNGVAYRYYEGEVESVNDIASLPVKKQCVFDHFTIASAAVEDHFAYEFEAYIQVPAQDVYTFYLRSDDGSCLYIDGEKVVDNDGGHSACTKKGSIGLAEGMHHIKILYFEDYMGQELQLGLESRSIKKGPIISEMLFISKTK